MKLNFEKVELFSLQMIKNTQLQSVKNVCTLQSEDNSTQGKQCHLNSLLAVHNGQCLQPLCQINQLKNNDTEK